MVLWTFYVQSVNNIIVVFGMIWVMGKLPYKDISAEIQATIIALKSFDLIFLFVMIVNN